MGVIECTGWWIDSSPFNWSWVWTKTMWIDWKRSNLFQQSLEFQCVSTEADLKECDSWIHRAFAFRRLTISVDESLWKHLKAKQANSGWNVGLLTIHCFSQWWKKTHQLAEAILRWSRGLWSSLAAAGGNASLCAGGLHLWHVRGVYLLRNSCLRFVVEHPTSAYSQCKTLHDLQDDTYKAFRQWGPQGG